MPALKELAADEEWWVRLNAAKALVNMGPEGEKALLELLQGEDRYARDRAAATLEAQGVTRRMVRQLAAPKRRGERARTIVGAVARSGATKYLRDLAETLPEGEERHILRRMLEIEDEPEPPVDAESPDIALVKIEPGNNESVRVETASMDESLGAEPADTLRGIGESSFQIVQQPTVELRQSSSKEQPAVAAKGEANHAVRIFRRSTPKADKNPSVDVQQSPASPQTPQQFEPQASAATGEAHESRLEDAGDRVSMRLEYETVEVDSLRAQIEGKTSRIRNVVNSRGTVPEGHRPDEPQSGGR